MGRASRSVLSLFSRFGTDTEGAHAGSLPHGSLVRSRSYRLRSEQGGYVLHPSPASPARLTSPGFRRGRGSQVDRRHECQHDTHGA